jgi:hypothetical protein
MNRQMRSIVADGPEIILEFDRCERMFYGAWYRRFFKDEAIRAFEGILSDGFDVIKRKRALETEFARCRLLLKSTS